MNAMKKETIKKAYAKLNISLDVTDRRADGYHDMVMVMQTVSLADEVRIALNETGRIRARTNLHFIPGDERNLAVKAALRYLREIGDTVHGADIEIHKRIPVGAGSFLGLSIPVLSENPMLIFILPPGGFFVFGILMAVVNHLAEKRGKPRAELRGCEACPMAASCTLTAHESCGKTDAKEAQN